MNLNRDKEIAEKLRKLGVDEPAIEQAIEYHVNKINTEDAVYHIDWINETVSESKVAKIRNPYQ